MFICSNQNLYWHFRTFISCALTRLPKIYLCLLGVLASWRLVLFSPQQPVLELVKVRKGRLRREPVNLFGGLFEQGRVNLHVKRREDREDGNGHRTSLDAGGLARDLAVYPGAVADQ